MENTKENKGNGFPEQDHFPFAPEYNLELSQYHTPPPLAALMAQLLPARISPMGIGGLAPYKQEGKPTDEPRLMRILEPSAGGGNLARAALEARRCEVTAVEIDQRWVRNLRDRFGKHLGVKAVHSEFLKFAEDTMQTWDAALMNPPLDHGVGVDHVAAALELAPVVVSLLRGQDLHGVKRHKRFWSQWGPAVDHLALCVGRGGFVGALSEFVVVRFDTGNFGADGTRLEWWR